VSSRQERGPIREGAEKVPEKLREPGGRASPLMSLPSSSPSRGAIRKILKSLHELVGSSQ